MYSKEIKKIVSKRNYKKYSDEIINNTEFLNDIQSSNLSDSDKLKERVYYIRNDIDKPLYCPICNKNLRFFMEKHSKISKYCQLCTNSKSANSIRGKNAYNTQLTKKSKQELNDFYKKTIKDKYHVDNIMEISKYSKKAHESWMKNKNKHIFKTKKTMIKKYGNSSPLKNKDIYEHYKKTIQDKYHVNNIMEVPEIARKLSYEISQNNYDKIILKNEELNKAVVPLFNREEYYGASKTSSTATKYRFQCKTCGTVFSDYINTSSNKYVPRCPKCLPYSRSSFEKDIYELIYRNYDKKIIQNDHHLNIEFDIYLPDINLAIECDGLYWHNESHGKDKNYHLNKTMIAEKNNIQLIHIFENEYIYKKELVYDKILYIIGCKKKLPKIYARKCIVKEISNTDKNNFLDNNHIQGRDVSSIRLGLYMNEKLVSVMTFSKPRRSLGHLKDNNISNYELVRFANDINFIVLGSFGKLFKYFTRNYKYNKIITYADRRWSSTIHHNLYQNNGFILDHIALPSYGYTKNSSNRGIIENRYKFRKSELKKLFPSNYQDSLSENQIMNNNGYSRIWNCGNYVYIYKNRQSAAEY